MKAVRSDQGNTDFLSLVSFLDAELKIRDGEDHEFYHQFNGVSQLDQVVVAYIADKAIGCGAIKYFDEETMEVKRMFVLDSARGQGVASAILHDLELWSLELGHRRCILETGMNQPESIALYRKQGYELTENYGQYIGIESSFCFQKNLK